MLATSVLAMMLGCLAYSTGCATKPDLCFKTRSLYEYIHGAPVSQRGRGQREEEGGTTVRGGVGEECMY